MKCELQKQFEEVQSQLHDEKYNGTLAYKYRDEFIMLLKKRKRDKCGC